VFVGQGEASHVLAAMGVDEAMARCGIRVSFGWTNSDSDWTRRLLACAV